MSSEILGYRIFCGGFRLIFYKNISILKTESDRHLRQTRIFVRNLDSDSLHATVLFPKSFRYY